MPERQTQTSMAELPNKETLTVEFKSDRKRLPDDDLVTTAVAMANTEGGVIYLGMEDDGTVTGLHVALCFLRGTRKGGGINSPTTQNDRLHQTAVKPAVKFAVKNATC